MKINPIVATICLTVVYLNLAPPSQSQAETITLEKLDMSLLAKFSFEEPCKNVEPFEDYFDCRFNHSNPYTREDILDRRTAFLNIYRHLWLESYLARHPFPNEIPKVEAFDHPKDLEGKKIDDSNQPYLIYKHRKRPIIFLIFSSEILRDLAFLRSSVFSESKRGQVMNSKRLYFYLASIEFITNSIDGKGGGDDFRASDLLKFYESAKRENIELNVVEQKVFHDLQELGVFSKDDSLNEVAILAVSQDAPRADRDHEFNHGLYSTDSTYRDGIANIFNNLTVETQRTAIDLIAQVCQFYDFSDRDLAIREFAARYHDPHGFIENDLGPLELATTANKKIVDGLSELIKKLDNFVPEYQQEK